MKQFSLMFVVVFMIVFAVPVFAQDPGGAAVNFTVQNLDPIADANIVAQYVNPNGVVDATINKVIGSRASDGFAAASSGLDDGWSGSVVVSADREIVAFGQAIWTNSTLSSSDPRYKTAGAYNGFNGGATSLYFPSLATRTDKQFSRVSVQSAETPSNSDTVAYTITFFDRDGNQTYQLSGETVHKGAQKTYDLSTISQLGNDWLGSAVITADNGTDLLAAVATTHWKNYSAAYSAVSSGGQKAYLPSGTRRIPNGTDWLQYTGIIVQNLDASNPVTATVTWYDRDGNVLTSFNDGIPANSSHGYNTRFINSSNVPDSAKSTLTAALSDDWNGSVVIDAGSGGQIVAVANLQWASAHPSNPNSASSYVSASTGNAELFAPAVFRRGANASTQFTGLIVQNVGSTTCSNYTVQWIARGATTPALEFTDSLDTNIAVGYNSKFNSTFPSGQGIDVATDLGDDFRGAAYINAPGCELVGIHNTVWPAWTDSTTYNVFGK